MLIIIPLFVMLFVPRTHHLALLCNYLPLTYLKRVIVVFHMGG